MLIKYWFLESTRHDHLLETQKHTENILLPFSKRGWDLSSNLPSLISSPSGLPLFLLGIRMCLHALCCGHILDHRGSASLSDRLLARFNVPSIWDHVFYKGKFCKYFLPLDPVRCVEIPVEKIASIFLFKDLFIHFISIERIASIFKKICLFILFLLKANKQTNSCFSMCWFTP